MSAFVDRFNMIDAEYSSESAERMRKGLGLGLTIGDFSDDRSMFIEK